MSTYTTGEIAKLCNVTVRTVQYYDNKGILIPSSLTEGGRRIYNDDDVKRLHLICYLRNIGLSIKNISEILSAENSNNVITTLLDEQSNQLTEEIDERKKQLKEISQIKSEMKAWSDFSIETFNDIAYVMDNKKKMKKLHIIMIVVGVIMDIIEIGTLLLWIFKGIWLPFAIGMLIVIILAIFLVNYVHKRTAFICPDCHNIFRPGMAEYFFAGHTPKTRKLRCSKCGKKLYCVETYREIINE